MANLSGALANFGLMSQGSAAADKAVQDREFEAQRIESAKRATTLQDQRIQEGQMGLEDMTRQRTEAASIRNAGATGSLLDMAKAAKAVGRHEDALKYEKLYASLDDEGFKRMLDVALKKPQPGYRPDIGEEFNRYGNLKVDPQSVTLDTKGNLSWQGKSGRESLNVGVTAERMGMVKSPTIHNIPAGGVGVISGVGRNPSDPRNQIRAPEKQTSKGYELGTFEENGVKYPVSFNKDKGTYQLLSQTGTPIGDELKVHIDPITGKGFATGKQGLFEIVPGTPGSPATSGFLGMGGKEAVPGTPTQLQPIARPGGASASQAPTRPPVAGARQSPKDGKWYVPDKNSKSGWAELVPKAGAGGINFQQENDKAMGSPKPTRPAPRARNQNEAATTVERGLTPTADMEDLPEVVASVGKRNAKGRHAEAVAAMKAKREVTRAEREAKEKQRPVETFRVIVESKRMTAEDAPLIEEAIKSGLLTPAEYAKAKKMLAKLRPQTAKYSGGGKVSKYQNHGLGV